MYGGVLKKMYVGFFSAPALIRLGHFLWFLNVTLFSKAGEFWLYVT